MVKSARRPTFSRIPRCFIQATRYVAEDGMAVELSGQTFISLPGNVPHALICGNQPCLFYLRYSRAFNIKIHPMLKLKKVLLEKAD